MSRNLSIYFASESGNAQGIATEIGREARNKNYRTIVEDLNSFLKVETKKDDVAVFVISTFGEGDPPSDYASAFRKLNKKARAAKATLASSDTKISEKLEYTGLQYAILGLGDTNYNNFCNASRTFISILDTLGAQNFYEPGFADDGLGLEEVVDPWIEGLWPHLETLVKKLEIEPPAIEDDTIKPSIGIDHSGLENLSVQPSTPTEFGIEGVKWKATRSLLNTIRRNLNVDFSSLSSVTKAVGVPKPVPGTLKIVKIGPDNELVGKTRDENRFPKEMRYPKWLFEPNESNSEKLFCAKVEKVQPLTTKQALKRTLAFELNINPKLENKNANQPIKQYIGNAEIIDKWEAGDSFGVLAPNDPYLVAALLERLNKDRSEWHVPVQIEGDDAIAGHHLKQFFAGSQEPMVLDSRAKKELFPTLFELFLYKIDIMSCPKKQLVRVFSDYCTNPKEKTQLLLASSRTGTSVYNVLKDKNTMASVLDVLNAFPSCNISVDLLVELLPPLAARPYSISSSSLFNKNIWRFAFNVVEHRVETETEPETEAEVGSEHSHTDANFVRYGVCSSYLDSITNHIEPLNSIKRRVIPNFVTTSSAQLNSAVKYVWGLNDAAPGSESESKLGSELQDVYIPVYLRQDLTKFRLPYISPPTSAENEIKSKKNDKPIIMIGAGTGIAPFIGFLEQRAYELIGASCKPETWMYLGFRNRDTDYLFEPHLQLYSRMGTLTTLRTCFSREERVATDGGGSSVAAKYVQDLIKEDTDPFINLVLEQDASIFVCGDALGMGKDVHTTIVDILLKASKNDAHKQKLFSYILREMGQPAEEPTGLTLTQANQVLVQWSKLGKYCRDLW